MPSQLVQVVNEKDDLVSVLSIYIVSGHRIYNNNKEMYIRIDRKRIVIEELMQIGFEEDAILYRIDLVPLRKINRDPTAVVVLYPFLFVC